MDNIGLDTFGLNLVLGDTFLLFFFQLKTVLSYDITLRYQRTVSCGLLCSESIKKIL